MTSPFWMNRTGRELDTTPLPDRASVGRIVACLNVWNDLSALQQSVPLWKSYVDHVIAVDGSYDTIGESLSTDGTREYLHESLESVEIINRAGVSQCEKRNTYLRGQDGDFLFIIDADEHLSNGPALCALPSCDVGWVRIRSPLYTREYGQPRILRWRPNLQYAGRHHWIYDGERLLCTHQYGGPGYIHRPVDVMLSNERNLGRDRARARIKHSHIRSQIQTEAPLAATPRTAMSDSKVGARECLHILNYAYRDDGIAPSRFHTAINRTTPHTSAFFKSRPGPFGVGTQYDARTDAHKLTIATNTADVVHIHTVVSLAVPIKRQVPVVHHHHGSLLRSNAANYMTTARRTGALVLVSNLELLSWTGDYPAFFLPNVVPVGRYLELAQGRMPSNTFRIAHSPTFHERKGTKTFLDVCARLVLQGIPVEPVLIENTSHADTLAIKATCHAAFDSFWLGMQCSGLEAAAMHLPVIAGDPTVRDRYLESFGIVPYTFANDAESLEDAIRRLVDDPDFREQEADRVFEYVTANHDESAVALTYLDYLDMAFDWRASKRQNGALRFQSQIRKEVTV